MHTSTKCGRDTVLLLLLLLVVVVVEVVLVAIAGPLTRRLGTEARTQ